MNYLVESPAPLRIEFEVLARRLLAEVARQQRTEPQLRQGFAVWRPDWPKSIGRPGARTVGVRQVDKGYLRHKRPVVKECRSPSEKTGLARDNICESAGRK
jgi:hypothetical protein